MKSTATDTPAYNADVFRLTREVRFAVPTAAEPFLHGTNGHGGIPPIEGLERFFTLRVSVQGALDLRSSYLRNIKDLDDAVRTVAIPRIARHVVDHPRDAGGGLLIELLAALTFDGISVVALALAPSPFHSLEVRTSEPGMMRVSQKFEFSAAHRLHNPALSDEENRALFGKCNNPRGHGHNYELLVTLVGPPDASGRAMSTGTLERLVDDVVLKRFDHKHLNEETAEFRTVNPSVEQIAKVCFDLLKPALAGKLASVTVWETPKTWCEYSE